jgi:hypothetical protein
MNQEEHDFWAELETLIKPVAVVDREYRLYYDKFGNIVACTMNQETVDQSDTYLVATETQYENYFRYRVEKGVLVEIDHDTGYRVNLVKHTQGYCVVKNHAGIILEPAETYPETEYYGYRNC